MSVLDLISLPVQHGLWEGLKIGYEGACNNFRDRSNEHTFGTDVYNFVTHALSELAPSIPGLHVLPSFGRFRKFRLQFNELEIACHRVGKSPLQSIHRSYPNNMTALTRMVQQQVLPGLEGFMAPIKKCVLAHVGNYQAGLIAAYICVPSSTNGHIFWVSAEQISIENQAMHPSIEDENIPPIVIERRKPEILIPTPNEIAALRHAKVSSQEILRSVGTDEA